MSDDPFGELLDQLLDAHDSLKEDPSRRGSEDASPSSIAPERVARGGRRPRRLALLVAVAVIASISSAGALVLQTQTSAPLTGRLPRDLLGTRYALEVGPDLMAGQFAWCTTLRALGSGDQPSLGPGSCETPRGGVIAQGGLAAVTASTGALTGLLLYAIVDQRVAALRRPDGTQVIPIHSPRLLPDWTAAVTIQSNPKPLDHLAAVTLTPISARGVALRAAIPQSAQTTQLPVRPVNPTRPPARGCAIDARGVPGIRLGQALTLRSAVPTRLAAAQPGLLSCYSVTFDVHGRSGVAAVLVDSRHPGRTPSELPGTRPLPGDQSVVTGPGAENLGYGFIAGGQLVAEPIRDGWLVVQISATTAASQRVLRFLQART